MKNPLEAAWETPRRPMETVRRYGIAVMNALGTIGETAQDCADHAVDALFTYIDGTELRRERDRQLLDEFARLSPTEQDLRLTLSTTGHTAHDLDLITGTGAPLEC